MAKSALVCRCITLHTYSASVTHDAWHVVTHVCECGRVHFEEDTSELSEAQLPGAPRKPRRPSAAKKPRARTQTRAAARRRAR